jgi:diguanylate cyclase (GGDEF)-like protein
MEIRLYFQMLRRGWWIILMTILTSLVVALAGSYLATPQYTAITRIIVSPSGALTSGNEVISSLDTLNNQSVMATYMEIMDSSRIYNDTLAFLKMRPEDLKEYSYTASVVSNSNIIELSVKGPDPVMAAKLANAIGVQTINFSNRLNQVFSVEFLDTATPPLIPSNPKPVLNVTLATILGLVVGVILAILSEELRLPLEAFKQRMHYDNMTGVYNNKYFSSLVEEGLGQNSKDTLSIGIIELNGLRDLLETFPIAGLQKVLREVTQILRRELRGNDIIGRWNDISFVVLLPNTPAAAASRIFERIHQMLSQPIIMNQFDLVVNLDAHIGGAEYGNNLSLQELFELANKALGQARRDNEIPVCILEAKTQFLSEKITIKK